MLPSTSSNSDQFVTVEYNDRTVKIDTDRPINIKWITGNNGLKTPTNEQRNKTRASQQQSDIPQARFKTLEKKTVGREKTFKMPNQYIQFNGRDEEVSHSDVVEYYLDREDKAWLPLINLQRAQHGYSLIDEEKLEKAIDFLENESHFQSGTLDANFPLVDNDEPCCICNDTEDNNSNQIIFCDMCNIAVHQECYGVPYIPEGQWLCRRCQLSPSMPVNCALCPFTFGAFKQTADGRWVHVICALWLNEVHFANTVFLEPVEGVDFSLKRRHKLTCLVCKRRRVGACLQCSHRTCVRSFHVTCAYLAGMKMVIQESRANKKDPEAITINRFVYCHQHSRDNGMKNDESMTAFKREIHAKIHSANKKLKATNREATTHCMVPVIPQQKIDQIAKMLECDNFSDVWVYWAQKRKSRCGVPLIRRLQVYQQRPIPKGPDIERPTSSRAASQQDAQQLKGQPMITSDPVQMMLLLRRNIERNRLLCELVKKREKLKLELLCANEQIIKKMVKPLSVLMQETVEKLVEKDHQKVFAQPVSEEDVPGYRAVITQPMDLQEMKRRLKSSKYKRISDLRSDFLLMMQNCATFNRDNQYFYNYGQRIKRIGLTVIRAAETEEHRINEFALLAKDHSKILMDTLNGEHLSQLKLELQWHKKREEQQLIRNCTNEAETDEIPLSVQEKMAEIGNQQEKEVKEDKGGQPQSAHRRSILNKNKKPALTLLSNFASSRSQQQQDIHSSNSSQQKHTGVDADSVANNTPLASSSSLGTSPVANNNSTPANIGNGDEGLFGEEGTLPHTTARRPSTSSRKRKRLPSVEKPNLSTIDGSGEKSKIFLIPEQNKKKSEDKKFEKPPLIRKPLNQPVLALPKSILDKSSSNISLASMTPPKKGRQKKLAGTSSSPQTPLVGAVTKTPNNGMVDGSVKRCQQPKQKKEEKSVVSTPPARPPKQATMGYMDPSRGIAKKTYANSYLTEASSTAGDSDDSLELGYRTPHRSKASTALANASSLEEEEEDDLPAVENNSSKLDLDRGIGVEENGKRVVRVIQKQQIDEFDCASPISFQHNDIVLAQMDDGQQIPARVIDPLMDFALKEELSSSVLREVRAQMPRNVADHQHTLVIFFNQHNSFKWLPNIRLEHYNVHCDQLPKDCVDSAVFMQAQARARQFWENVIL